MIDKKEILINIYQEAKKLRIVHTQDEFAAALGFKSRTHLFGRLMKGEGEIPDAVIKKAKDLLNGANNVTFKSKDINSVVSEMQEVITYLKASDRIQGMLLVELASIVKKTSISKEVLELENNVRSEANRLFDELNKK